MVWLFFYFYINIEWMLQLPALILARGCVLPFDLIVSIRKSNGLD